MNNLSILGNKHLTITSVELVKIINDFRRLESEASERKYSKLQHYDFYKKIKKEIETLEKLGLNGDGNFSESSYADSQNKQQPCYF